LRFLVITNMQPSQPTKQLLPNKSEILCLLDLSALAKAIIIVLISCVAVRGSTNLGPGLLGAPLVTNKI